MRTKIRVEGKSSVFEHFFDGGGAEVNIAQAVFTEGIHAQLHGFLFDDHGGGSAGDEVANGIGYIEQFVEASAAAVAGLAANIAAGAGEELFVAELMG